MAERALNLKEVPSSNPLSYRPLDKSDQSVKVKAHTHLCLSGTPPPHIMLTGVRPVLSTIFSGSCPQQASCIQSNFRLENIEE